MRDRTRWGWGILGAAALATLMACGGSVASLGGAPGDAGNAEGGVVGHADASPDGGNAAEQDSGIDVREGGSEMEACCARPSLPLPMPSFTPPGGTQPLGSAFTIQAGQATPVTAQIFFTTSGVVPTCNGSVCTGMLYVGPVQLLFQAGLTEVVVAIAHDPTGTYLDSPPATAVYTESTEPPCCEPVPVTFNPTSMISNNDFLVSLSDPPGATICYTLDGSTPTCSNGVCTGVSQTYNAATRVSIDGNVTNAATGQVTVTAIGCMAGIVNSQSVSQVYQLQVADPTMTLAGNQVPAGTGLSNVPWPGGAGGLAPTVGTATQDSVAIADPVSIRYTTGGTAPTCATGTTIANGATLPLDASTTVQAIGCKKGYSPSSVATTPISLQENPPVLAPGGPSNPYPTAFTLSESGGGISDTANAGGAGSAGPGGQADWICAATGGTASCGASFDACGAGNVLVTATGGGVGVPGGATTTVSAVACGVGVNPSATVTVAYTVGP